MWSKIVFEDKYEKLKMCVINPKANTKMTKQRYIANKPIKHIEWNHKKC